MDSTIHRQVLAQLGFTVEKTGRFYALKDRAGSFYVEGNPISWAFNRMSETAAWQDAPSLQALMPMLMRRMLNMHPGSKFHVHFEGADWHVALHHPDYDSPITATYGTDLYECVAVAFLR